MGTSLGGIANCNGCHCMPDEEINEVITASAKLDTERSTGYRSIRLSAQKQSH